MGVYWALGSSGVVLTTDPAVLLEAGVGDAQVPPARDHALGEGSRWDVIRLSARMMVQLPTSVT